jgi:hypothetical protein
MLNQLPPTIIEFIDGVNAFDIGRIMATFAGDAQANDNHREYSAKQTARGESMIIGCVVW